MRSREARLPGLALFALVGCDETLAAVPEPESPAADAGAAGDDSPGTSFAECPGAYAGACASVDVPLDWDRPDGRTIPLFIDKIWTSPNPKGQLWLLQGGPGGAGADMVPIAMAIARARQDLDIYTLDHRGVGQSARLGCDSEPTGATTVDALTAWRPCLDSLVAEWGDGLAHFSTTEAARDLAHAIDLMRRPGEPVFLYGVSYGAYWAHRYLQLFPEHPTGVVLDSILPPDGDFISRFDFHFDAVAQKLADACKLDAACRAALGSDPWTKLQSIADKLEAGHCAASGFAYSGGRVALANMFPEWKFRPVALAAMARLDRCNAADVAALKVLKGRLTAVDARPSSYSQALNFNVTFSELWETPAPSWQTLATRSAEAVFPAGIVEVTALQEAWPKYAPDAFARNYATTRVPMLMMNGTLDAQTPIESAEILESKFTAPHQTFVAIPNADHTVILQSPVTTPGRPSCGFSIMMSFLDDPTGTLDTSCLADLAPLDFSPDVGTRLFGAPSIWSGAASITPFEKRRGSLRGNEWLPTP